MWYPPPTPLRIYRKVSAKPTSFFLKIDHQGCSQLSTNL
jgi:hypothetical protein